MKDKKNGLRDFIIGFLATLVLTMIANYFQGPDPKCEKSTSSGTSSDSISTPYGLFVACLLNFACDGLMAGELLKSKQKVAPTFFGLSLDNMVLLFVLGSRLHSSKHKMWTLCSIVIVIFFMCMMIGLTHKGLADLSDKFEPFFKGVVFNVLIYTILVELCPEASEFKNYYNCDIEELTPADKSGMDQGAMFLVNNWGYFYPIILFASFFLMKFSSAE